VVERAPAGAGTDSVGGAPVAGCYEPVTPILGAAEIDRGADGGPAGDDAGAGPSLVLEQHFAVVPEWIIDADISDCAYRLYSVLLRYGQTSGQRMPARATLADRLRKTSKDTVDRALKELVAIGAVVVERRRRDGRNLTNRYLLMATPPQARAGATPAGGGGRKNAATPGRTDAATLAANLRPDPESSTQTPPPPPPPSRSPSTGGEPAGTSGRPPRATHPDAADAVLLARCGIGDLQALAADCQRRRRRLGAPTARWTAGRLLPVIAQAAKVGGWPPQLIGPALRALAVDPATRSPMRLPYPGPWWDTAETGQMPSADRTAHIAEQERLEARLAEADGSRVWAQQQARAQLTARGETVTRLAVARLACQLLDQAELSPC